MRRPFTAFLFVLTLLLPSTAWAWGCTGHQVVAYIPAENLNGAAAAKVADLLSDVSYGSIQRYCAPTKLGNIEFYATWADDERTPTDANWHFWDVPLTQTSAAMPEFCGDGCIVSALKRQIDILRDPNPGNHTRIEQQRALMFVIHFVGDEHQPLHIEDNGDRGGNCVPVNFNFKGDAHKATEGKDKSGMPNGSYSPNLHSIWDTSLIETMTGMENDANRDQLTQAFADSIVKGYSTAIQTAKATKVNFDTDIEAWAIQTHKLAQTYAYAALPTPIPLDPAPAMLTSCLGVSAKLAPLNEIVQVKYIAKAQPVVRRQLALAGARLAATLNTIWPEK